MLSGRTGEQTDRRSRRCAIRRRFSSLMARLNATGMSD
jgi:hypothetical protein